MLQRSTTWISENRLLAAGVALIVVAVVAGFALLSGGEDVSGRLSRPDAAQEAEPGEETGEGEDTPDGRSGNVQAGAPAGAIPGVPSLPGVPSAASCDPKPVDQPGVTDKTITIGQIVTNSNQIPQQLEPAHDGLNAFIKAFNAGGGLCKRQLRLEYRNDGLIPSTHRGQYQELAARVLAFVGNESLLDFLDYGQQPPFEPNEEVPDVGGLAFSYFRSQSRWHAGVVGSVSPVLIGGGQFRFFLEEARSKGKPCVEAGVVHFGFTDPTGASEDQAQLGKVALEKSWGGNLGSGKADLYSVELRDQVPNYELLVDRMISDGKNCVFTYTDVQSNINLVQAMNSRGVWPPDKCTRLDKSECFRVTYIPLSAFDSRFITEGEAGARSVSTFIPHVPFGETSDPGMKAYLASVRALGDRPSTFSLFGFASGAMFVQALAPCAATPTRACLMNQLHDMKDFTAGGLLGGTTPFRTTKVTYSDERTNYGTFDFKWIFNRTIAMRVLDRNGKRDFYRINPNSGFFTDTLKVARGTPG